MCRGKIRIDPQRRFILLTRLIVPARAQQQIGEIDARHRICRVVKDRLGIDAAGGVDRADLREQGPELVQRAEMRGRPAQDVDESLLGFPAPVEDAKQRRAFDFEFDAIAAARLPREQSFELGHSRILREPRGPAGLAGGDIARDSGWL
jgi:hypothetical protein